MCLRSAQHNVGLYLDMCMFAYSTIQLFEESHVLTKLLIRPSHIIDQFILVVIEIYVCCCVVRNSHMGGMRGGVKRGGKGLLQQYFLNQKVPVEIMTKMMKKVMLFKYFPGRIMPGKAMRLFLKEYVKYVHSRVRKHYLDPPNPQKLCGCATGVQDQVGSTNVGEKRGGIW